MLQMVDLMVSVRDVISQNQTTEVLLVSHLLQYRDKTSFIVKSYFVGFYFTLK